jgi:steroid delta-isomerase-like uncharacterized protein
MSPPGKVKQMTSEPRLSLREAREAIVLEHLAAENRHDIDATVATFHHPRYEINGETSDGETAVRTLLEELLTGFPDLCIDPQKIHHADDAVIGEGRMTGTHTGTFANIPATGRSIDYRAVAIFEFDNDRLVCEKVHFDSATLLRQLGILRPADA